MMNPSAGDTVIPTKTSRTTTGEPSSRGRRRLHRVRAESNPGPRKRQLEPLSMKTEVPRKNPRHGEPPQEVVGDRMHAAAQEAIRNANLKRTRGGAPSTATSTDSHVHVNSAKIRRKTLMDVPGSHSLKSRDDQVPGKVKHSSVALKDNVVLKECDLEDVPGSLLRTTRIESPASPGNVPAVQSENSRDEVRQSTMEHSVVLITNDPEDQKDIVSVSGPHTSSIKSTSVSKQRIKSVPKPLKRPPEETDCIPRIEESQDYEEVREDDCTDRKLLEENSSGSMGLAEDSETLQRSEDVEVSKLTRKSLVTSKNHLEREQDLKDIGNVVEKNSQDIPEKRFSGISTKRKVLENCSSESAGVTKDSEELRKEAEEIKLKMKLPESNLHEGSKILKQDDSTKRAVLEKYSSESVGVTKDSEELRKEAEEIKLTMKLPESNLLKGSKILKQEGSTKQKLLENYSNESVGVTKNSEELRKEAEEIKLTMKLPESNLHEGSKILKQEGSTKQKLLENCSSESVGVTKDSEELRKEAEEIKLTMKLPESNLREGSKILKQEDSTKRKRLENCSSESVGVTTDSEELRKETEEIKLTRKLPEGQLRSGLKVLRRDDSDRLRKTIQWLEEGARRMRDDLATTRSELHEERRAARMLKREVDSAVREARTVEAAKYHQIISELKLRISQSPSRPSSESTTTSSKAEFLKDENHRRELSALRKRLAESEATVQKLKSNSLDSSNSGKRRKLENNKTRRLETEAQSLRAANKELEAKLNAAMEAEKSRATELRAQHEDHEAQLAALQKTLRSDTIKMMDEIRSKSREIEKLEKLVQEGTQLYRKLQTKEDDLMRKLRESERGNQIRLAPRIEEKIANDEHVVLCKGECDAIAEVERLRELAVEQQEIIDVLRQAVKEKERKLDQLSNKKRKEEFYKQWLELEPVAEVDDEEEQEDDSALSSAPSSLSPQPGGCALWPSHGISREAYETMLLEVEELQTRLLEEKQELAHAKSQVRELEKALLQETRGSQNSRRVLSDKLREVEEREATLVAEVSELREQNELLEFRVLELEESPGLRDTPDPADSGIVSPEPMHIYKDHLNKQRDRAVATVIPYNTYAHRVSPIPQKPPLSLQESGIFEEEEEDEAEVELASRGTQTETQAGELLQEVQRLHELRARIQERASKVPVPIIDFGEAVDLSQSVSQQERIRDLEERLGSYEEAEDKRVKEKELSRQREEELLDENYRLTERIHWLENSIRNRRNDEEASSGSGRDQDVFSGSAQSGEGTEVSLMKLEENVIRDLGGDEEASPGAAHREEEPVVAEKNGSIDEEASSGCASDGKRLNVAGNEDSSLEMDNIILDCRKVEGASASHAQSAGNDISLMETDDSDAKLIEDRIDSGAEEDKVVGMRILDGNPVERENDHLSEPEMLQRKGTCIQESVGMDETTNDRIENLCMENQTREESSLQKAEESEYAGQLDDVRNKLEEKTNVNQQLADRLCKMEQELLAYQKHFSICQGVLERKGDVDEVDCPPCIRSFSCSKKDLGTTVLIVSSGAEKKTAGNVSEVKVINVTEVEDLERIREPEITNVSIEGTDRLTEEFAKNEEACVCHEVMAAKTQELRKCVSEESDGNKVREDGVSRATLTRSSNIAMDNCYPEEADGRTVPEVNVASSHDTVEKLQEKITVDVPQAAAAESRPAVSRDAEEELTSPVEVEVEGPPAQLEEEEAAAVEQEEAVVTFSESEPEKKVRQSRNRIREFEGWAMRGTGRFRQDMQRLVLYQELCV